MSRRRPWLVLLAALVLASSLPPAPAAAASEVWVTTTLTRGADDQGYVFVSGDRLAWSGWDGDASRVRTWRAGDAAPTTLAGDAPVYDDLPRVSGDRVVWRGSRGVYTWTPGGGASLVRETPLSDSLDVSGDRVVWLEQVAGSGHSGAYDVFTWTPGAGTHRLTDSGGFKGGLRVSGDRLVWAAAGGAVWTWRSGESTPTRIAATSSGSRGPQVSGDRVVWIEGTGTGTDVFTWTPASGVTRVTDNSFADLTNWTGALSADRLVWQASPSGTGYDLFTWTSGTGPARLTNTGNVAGAQVSGDRIVWSAGRDGRRQILTWTPSGGVAQVSRNTYDNVDPAVSGDRVAWRARIGGRYQILTAAPKAARIRGRGKGPRKAPLASLRPSRLR